MDFHEISDAELRRLFDVYTSPLAHTLSLVLGGVQKDGHSDWFAFVNDVMAAMELDDCGQFPDEWFDEDEL